jgi:predicted Zn-dependent peptidase
MGEIGAQANAYTSEEQTVYYAGILPEHLPQMLDILSDMIYPAFDQKEFDMEKKVILEEIALYQDRPIFSLMEQSMKRYFAGHPAGNSVLGTIESVGGISRDQMVSYHGSRYVAAQMALVITGKFQVDDSFKLAEKLTAHFPTGKRSRTLSTPNPAYVKDSIKRKDQQQSHVLFCAPGPDNHQDERYEFGVLSSILGAGDGSRAYWSLVDKGIAEGAGVDGDERDDCGVIYAFASTEPQRIDEVSATLRDIITAPKNLTPAEVNRAAVKLATKVVLGGEQPMGRLMAIGSEWLAEGKVTALAEVAARIERVSVDSINAALKKYPLDNWAEFRLIPE